MRGGRTNQRRVLLRRGHVEERIRRIDSNCPAPESGVPRKKSLRLGSLPDARLRSLPTRYAGARPSGGPGRQRVPQVGPRSAHWSDLRRHRSVLFRRNSVHSRKRKLLLRQLRRLRLRRRFGVRGLSLRQLDPALPGRKETSGRLSSDRLRHPKWCDVRDRRRLPTMPSVAARGDGADHRSSRRNPTWHRKRTVFGPDGKISIPGTEEKKRRLGGRLRVDSETERKLGQHLHQILPSQRTPERRDAGGHLPSEFGLRPKSFFRLDHQLLPILDRNRRQTLGLRRGLVLPPQPPPSLDLFLLRRWAASVGRLLSSSRLYLFLPAVRGQEELMRDAEPYLPVVRRRVADMVRDATGLAWTRISRVLVDFEVSGLLADVSLLDRPDYLWDFSYDSEGFLADPEDSVGMVSKHLCAKFCLEYPGMCYAFSYCGKTCYLKTKSSWTKRDSPGCLIYRRKTGYEPLITTDSALQKLNLALESGDLKISFSVKDVAGNYRDVELSVSAFDSHARDPDARYTKIADFDSHYTEYKYGYKLKKGADHVRNLGSLPYLTCQKTCLADPYCQSLSSCAGMAECLTSTKHAVEVPDRELVKKNDCLVLTRNYMDSFVRHDGLTKATTAAKRLPIDKQELCAKACLRDDEVDCRSFDFCPYSEHPSDRCLLHAGRHPDPRNEKLALDPTGLCGHYSRNHVRDFRKLKNRIPVDPAHLAVTGVTAEGCARLCAEGVEFPCGSFHFCRAGGRGKARCGLRTENDVSPATVSNSSCDTYLPAESSPEGRKAGRRGERSYSSGLTAGLGVFFFVLGSGFAVVALLIFGKITGRKI
ncbi:uncharacterized protein LOC111626573 isoform X3 [Centruroides sculpturatus]|uniref:uncharacterized protein LOC111626573 isoform X3 n=1 Tax=Centruroides sculpturatus TaxID=218467 RepID=UPI000C6D90ED|nr:uncharacterized protein LOC111626573 isoform X3 [Centruroides sculpturatus]